MKRSRQQAIIDIINEYDVKTQGELGKRLEALGYDVTQATVSRDIRDLKLIKAPGSDGKQRYALPGTKNTVSTVGAARIFSEGVTSVDHVNNIVIVKTLSGMANAVCAGIDALADPDILGTVAGDDTIMCVVRDIETAVKLIDELRKK
ncbi:MAG: arginine repressor [Clostridiales bacterium]|nr:arginine repressor [Clostridiales bacterium]